MKTLDRYIVRSFLTTALLFFAVMISMRVMADLAFNMDDFTTRFTQLKIDNLWTKITYVFSYYGYQSLIYFMELGGVIIVASAAFTLATMNHSNELTAMLASGVSLHRVTAPIVLCAMVLGGMVFVDQEFIIPRVADRLVLKRGEVAAIKQFRVTLIPDSKGTVWWAKNFHGGTRRMDKPAVVLRDRNLKLLAFMSGSEAHPYEHDGEPGWLLRDAKLARNSGDKKAWPVTPNTERIWSTVDPQAILEQARLKYRQAYGKDAPLESITRWPGAKVVDPTYGMTIQGQFVPVPPSEPGEPWGGKLIQPTFTFREDDGRLLGIFIAESARWQQEVDRDNSAIGKWYWQLEGGALFCESDLNPEKLLLRQSSEWMGFMSTSDLSRLIQLKRVPDRKGAELIKHSRFAAPLNNLVMLLLGLPFILSRERNIRVSAGLCVLVVCLFFASIYICQYIGIDPIFAAWLPILAFGPAALLMFEALKT